MSRNIRVSTISFSGAGSGGEPAEKVERNREAAMKLVEQAVLDKPDIVVLPEFFNVLGLNAQQWFEAAETVPGPTTEMFGKVAMWHNCYIVLPFPERKNNRVYNSSVLLDRQGMPVGSYHKMHPTIGEIEAGITPGRESPTFETDFGRVAFAICFDLNFRDVAESAATGKPDLLIFSSMYRGGLQTQIWAHDLSLYVVSSITGPHSMIVNPLGHVIAMSEAYNPIISRIINLDYVVCHIDYNNTRWQALKEKYGRDAELEVASPEAKFLLTSCAQGIHARDMVKEFDMETLEDYWVRANSIRERALRNIS